MPASDDDAVRVDAFLALFNEVDDLLRTEVGASRRDSMLSASRRFGRSRSWWMRRFHGRLETLNSMRNFLVHEHKKVRDYLAFPSDDAFETLREAKRTLASPSLAYDVATKPVRAVAPDDPIDAVLAIVKDEAITNFPVYEDDRLVGLLTSNGLTHWMAEVASVGDAPYVDVATVGDVVEREEADPPNHVCVPRNVRVEDAAEAFVGRPTLQAVIVTENGRPTEHPLGILTAWDVATLPFEGED